MAAALVDGREARDELLTALRGALITAGSPSVTLATVRVDDGPLGARWIAYKHAAAERVGIRHLAVTLPAGVDQAGLAGVVGGLDDDPAVHGIFVQLPLPAGLAAPPVLDRVRPAKDIDGAGAPTRALLARGEPGHVPATPLAVLHLLQRAGVAVTGAPAVIVAPAGVPAPAGIPGLVEGLALVLRGAGAAATVVGAGDPAARDVCREADIVISTAGMPGLVGGDWVQPGAAVVDLGTARVGGALRGDVDLRSVLAVAGTVVPAAGGAGPVTVAALLVATARAAGFGVEALPSPGASFGDPTGGVCDRAP